MEKPQLKIIIIQKEDKRYQKLSWVSF